MAELFHSEAEELTGLHGGRDNDEDALVPAEFTQPDGAGQATEDLVSGDYRRDDVGSAGSHRLPHGQGGRNEVAGMPAATGR